MTFDYETQFMGDYLRVTTCGTLDSVSEVEAYVDMLRKEAQKHNTQKVLIDERKLMDQQDTLDAYEVSESDVAVMAALAGIRLSCICHPSNFELNKTYETFLLNRSLVFKAFLEEHEAIQWLMK